MNAKLAKAMRKAARAVAARRGRPGGAKQLYRELKRNAKKQ